MKKDDYVKIYKEKRNLNFKETLQKCYDHFIQPEKAYIADQIYNNPKFNFTNEEFETIGLWIEKIRKQTQNIDPELLMLYLCKKLQNESSVENIIKTSTVNQIIHEIETILENGEL